MNNNEPVFIEIPEAERRRLAGLFDGRFPFDFSIPLPLNLDGEAPADAVSAVENLTEEAVLSGILKVLAAPKPAVNPGWLEYYRRLVIAARPRILGEFTEAAILKARNGDHALALEIFDALRGLFPGNRAVLFNRALALEQTAQDQRGEDASQAWDEVLALDPPFPNGLFNGGFYFLKIGDLKRAKECFSRYAVLAQESLGADELGADGCDETDEHTHDDRENSDFPAEKLAEAEAILKDIAENHLEDEEYAAACRLVREGREQEALPAIRGFLERFTKAGNGWFLLGWALRKLGRWQDGEAAFRQALAHGGRSLSECETRNELAICLMEQGKLTEARRELETALLADAETGAEFAGRGSPPANVKIISNLGVLAMKAGKPDEAAAFFRTVLDISPDDPVASSSLAALER